MLKYLHENGCLRERTCLGAAAGGHLEVLKYLHERVPLGRVYAAAAEGGHLGVLKWARDGALGECLCRYAARRTRCLGGGGAWGRVYVQIRCRGRPPGDAEARENGCPWERGRADTAAREGAPGGAAVCTRTGALGGGDACRSAAEGGHLEVLEYARENGCPWDEGTCMFAHPRCRPYLIGAPVPGSQLVPTFTS